MKVRWALPISGLLLAVSVMPMLAHHSVPAQYDVSHMITIQGVVTRIEWMNPHARFWVDAKNNDDTVSNWGMELPPPNALKREFALKKESEGMDFVKPGDQVTVDFWPAKDGARLGHALTLTLPDGRVIKFPHDWGMPPASK